MADIKLTFNLTLKGGVHATQTISVPADGDGEKTPTPDQIIMTVLQQYAAVGMLKRDGNKFLLISASQIEAVEVEIPSLVTASDKDLKSFSPIVQQNR